MYVSVSVLQGKLSLMEAAVREHQQYLEAVRDLSDWLASAREELQRWADVSGDADAVQRKLAKVRVSSTVYLEQCLKLRLWKCKNKTLFMLYTSKLDTK